MVRQVTCVVRGRVQGVLYRDFAQRKAHALGVVGTVENMPDGTVRVCAQAEESVLDTYLSLLKKGSFLSRVERVEVMWGNSLDIFSDFRII